MKKTCIFLLCLVSATLLAQNNKSLFWEISGNGLTKKSYIYGTMHVNDKVSYHLSDTFFAKLLAADMVANESDPATWDEVEDLMSRNEISSAPKFYSEFYMASITKDNILPIFYNKYNYFNKLLSGFDEDNADYQESTVLDSFIYQTGRKYNKKTVGLEDAMQSMLSLAKVDREDAMPKDESRQLLMKITKNKGYSDVMKDFYREKDIVMLDSISKLIISKKAHDALIVNRNIVMVKSMDSLMKQGSLFAAVGAAHLAGKKGMLKLLEEKGYTLTPIFDIITEDGKKEKKKIEEFFPNPNFITKSTNDQMVQMPLNDKITYDAENIGSPDFTNGGVTSIKRIPLNYFVNPTETAYNPRALDSLFFEQIPGEIIEKKYIEEENFKGYDIKSITKTGNSQHYRFYITPLELIGISMTGVKNYVRQYENSVFDNIKLKPFKNNWEKITPKKGGFSVEIPSYNFVYGNTTKRSENIEIQAYDNTEKSYYFLTERTLSDNDILEDSAYEQKQIHYEFYLQHKADSLNTHYDKIKESYESSSKIGERKIRLKSFIKANKYYLLGAVNANDEKVNTFFNSFSFEKNTSELVTKTLNDTIANFKIDIPEKQNEQLFIKNLSTSNYRGKTKNTFQSQREDYSILSESGSNINLTFYKYSKYESADNLDAIKKNFRDFFLKQEDDEEVDTLNYDDDEYSNNASSLTNSHLNEKKGFSRSVWNKLMKDTAIKYEMLNESEVINKEKNTHTFNALVSKPNSTQAIKYKILFKQDSYYLLTALVDRNYKNDNPFIEKAFGSIEPTTKSTYSLFDDKVAVFIADAKSTNDTIRYSAFQSAYQLDVTKKDVPALKEFLTTFKFKKSENDPAEALLVKIGKIQDKEIIPFLEDLYKKETTKTSMQLSILKALSNQKSKVAYHKIIELLEYDLPISDEEFEINQLFYYLTEDAETSKELFPKIFQFYSIKEYNKPILEFCNTLLDKNLISAKKISSFKKMLVTSTKLEYKRLLSWNEKNNSKQNIEINPAASDTLAVENEEVDEAVETAVAAVKAASIDEDEDEDYTYGRDNAPTEDLINYINLLYHFPNDSAINELIAKIKRLDIESLNVELLRLDMVNNKLSPAEIQKALHNPKTRFATVELLIHQDKKDFLSLSDDEIAEAAVINFQNKKETDVISLLEKRTVIQKGKEVIYYFYQIETKARRSETTEKELYPIAFITDNGRINPLAYKVFGTQEIDDEVVLSESYDRIIKESLNEDHPRASFEKAKPNSNYYNIHDDY